jgi:hypothetical protein
MPDSVVLGTLPTGAAQEIGATSEGRLKVDADFLNSSTDSFGRLRVSHAFTLFDSSHRFSDNGLWLTSASTGGTAAFNASQGLVDLAVTSASGSEVLRETKKTFAYQPGKSLLCMNTFVFSAAKTNLRQRVGYFGTENGIYLQQDGTQISLVLRSKVSGSIVNTVINQASWNGDDKLDGTGPSKKTLDLSKAQIFWSDLEWLGVGTVRCGFVIDGQFILCHCFNHANIISSTYTTTACLPLRYEITNTGATSGASTLKQICSTLLSEGGYELRGKQLSAGTSITSAYSMTTAGTYYPLVALRLKSTALDGIVVPTQGSITGTGNGLIYRWQIISDATITGGTWVSAGSDSSVEYNISGTAVSGGSIVSTGYTTSSNQSSAIVNIIKQSLFALQLERNSFTSTPLVVAIALSCNTNTTTAFGSIDWEEVTR